MFILQAFGGSTKSRVCDNINNSNCAPNNTYTYNYVIDYNFEFDDTFNNSKNDYREDKRL